MGLCLQVPPDHILLVRAAGVRQGEGYAPLASRGAGDLGGSGGQTGFLPAFPRVDRVRGGGARAAGHAQRAAQDPAPQLPRGAARCGSTAAAPLRTVGHARHDGRGTAGAHPPGRGL